MSLTYARLRDLTRRLLVVMDAFAGEGLAIDGHEDPADLCVAVARALGTQDQDMCVRRAIEALTPRKQGRPGHAPAIVSVSSRVKRILKRLDAGESPNSIARRYKITKQAVSSIRTRYRPETTPYRKVRERRKSLAIR